MPNLHLLAMRLNSLLCKCNETFITSMWLMKHLSHVCGLRNETFITRMWLMLRNQLIRHKEGLLHANPPHGLVYSSCVLVTLVYGASRSVCLIGASCFPPAPLDQSTSRVSESDCVNCWWCVSSVQFRQAGQQFQPAAPSLLPSKVHPQTLQGSQQPGCGAWGDTNVPGSSAVTPSRCVTLTNQVSHTSTKQLAMCCGRPSCWRLMQR
jgi:hypothetical protein